jgi:hypothetical protein
MKNSLLRLLSISSGLVLSLSAQTPAAEAPTEPAAGTAIVVQSSTGETTVMESTPGAATERRGGRQQRNNPNNPRRGNFDPAEMQARMMNNLREQMGVKEDDEWALISERITAVMELRRGQATGAAGAFFAIAAGANARGGNRIPGFAGNSEQDALRAAVTDNLPDAEITARLARLRDARKQSEAKLDQARENLRAVLTVRQEAVAVMMGLLN